MATQSSSTSRRTIPFGELEIDEVFIYRCKGVNRGKPTEVIKNHRRMGSGNSMILHGAEAGRYLYILDDEIVEVDQDDPSVPSSP